MNKHPDNISFVFFGTPYSAVLVLEELKKKNLLPSLIVTNPDRPQGRGQKVQQTPVAIWGEENEVGVYKPEKLDEEVIGKLQEREWDLFVLAAYGKLIPPQVLSLPKHGILNVHPSLLPKWRGASPIQAQILHNEDVVGVTIMKMDEGLDTGPIVDQEAVLIEEWPLYASELNDLLFKTGGALLADVIPAWVEGNIDPQEQDHSLKTYMGKIKKEDAEIDLNADPHENLLKIYAYDMWPTAYFFDGEKRIKITKAHLENGKLMIDRVIPEGKGEMDYSDWKQ